MRQFLAFAGKNTIEDVQAFTAQWAPSPRWVRTDKVDVPHIHLQDAATHLQAQLGPDGLHAVGGRTWWQWRQDDNQLEAEWIEMRKDHDLRKHKGNKCQRSMLYVHGGAYYFGSVDAHRYQMQRHARKLQARVLAPRYRLAPQFPFPCGLMDCLATYLFLLTVQEPDTIIIAGDSAGGGMVMSMLIILRDQGLPLPAGAILLSPWVDLTHSFPSVAGGSTLDYVPPDSFHHKPSMSWPPPDTDELNELGDVMIEMDGGQKIPAKVLRERAREQLRKGKARESVPSAKNVSDTDSAPASHTETSVPHYNPTVTIDTKSVVIKDQLQFYAPNELISHPLISPVLQPTLGGLPPLCILVGGGELLRDEQIYLAHKAADPAAYPPPCLEDFSDGSNHHHSLSSRAAVKEAIAHYPATNVQLQIWDDLCHVATTLAWTRPAKYMYRSVAQFGAWALARAQMSEIRILDDDSVSVISSRSSSSVDSDDPASAPSHSQRRHSPNAKRRASSSRRRSKLRPESKSRGRARQSGTTAEAVGRGLHRPTTPATVGRAGEPLPLFKDHMIRQRVTRHGDIYNLDPPNTLPACTMAPREIGIIKPGPVKKWLHVQNLLGTRFGDLKRDIQSKRVHQMAETSGGRGMVFTAGREDTMVVGEEHPPPTALAGRTTANIRDMGLLRRKKHQRSSGLAMWSGWGSKHDEEAIDKEEEKVQKKQDVTMSVVNVRKRHSAINLLGSGPILGGGPLDAPAPRESSGEPSSAITATAEATVGRETVPAEEAQTAQGADDPSAHLGKPTRTTSNHPILHMPTSEPPMTVPFKLARPVELPTAQASTLTLDEADGVIVPDSATLPSPGQLHYSIASTMSTDPRSSGVPHETVPKIPKDTQASDRLAVPVNAATTGVADESRPSTATGSDRPISPGEESLAESLPEETEKARVVSVMHARGASKGDIPATPTGARGMPPLPSAHNEASATVVSERNGHTVTGNSTVPVPEVGSVHGGESNDGKDEIRDPGVDSGRWASGVLSAVVDGSTENGRPGVERFVTATDPLELKP